MNKAMCLYTSIKEPTGVLNSFCSALSQAFIAAGLETRRLSDLGKGEPNFRQARALCTRGLKSGIPNTKPALKGLRLHKVPRFDARGICEKFKDVVWAKDVHLDRVFISETHPETLMEDGQNIGIRYRDIVSIPLPGAIGEPRSFEYLKIPYHEHGAQVLVGDRE